jgi:hypothetical protein
MDANGKLIWDVPAGEWTILRIGHVNTGQKNGPAPAEATGWEATKLHPDGIRTNFNGYIGRLIRDDGVLKEDYCRASCSTAGSANGKPGPPVWMSSSGRSGAIRSIPCCLPCSDMSGES